MLVLIDHSKKITMDDTARFLTAKRMIYMLLHLQQKTPARQNLRHRYTTHSICSAVNETKQTTIAGQVQMLFPKSR